MVGKSVTLIAITEDSYTCCFRLILTFAGNWVYHEEVNFLVRTEPKFKNNGADLNLETWRRLLVRLEGNLLLPGAGLLGSCHLRPDLETPA